MQATLLIMCFAWRHRQHKLGIDDFGHPLHSGDERSLGEPGEREGYEVPEGYRDDHDTEGGEDMPLLVKNVDREDRRWWQVLKWTKGRRS